MKNKISPITQLSGFSPQVSDSSSHVSGLIPHPSEDVLVRVENVSKKFCRSLKRAMWYGVKDIGSELIGRRNDPNAKPPLRPDEFWAVRDVSFELKRGDFLGLIGHNGSGKSTLLKMLNGLIKLDTGRIEMRGNTRALIELGTGFNPILSGRENIFINGSLHGFTKADIDRKYDAIVEFSELNEFIDMPVQNFSSGMKARLGFAIVNYLDPDILLIDEVLAVGDMAFQEKCMRRMDELRQQKKAIVFVTHSLYQVESLCNKAMWLDHGEVVQYGGARDVVRAYLDHQEKKSMQEAQKAGQIHQGRAIAATKAYLDYMDNAKENESAKNFTKIDELIKILKIELLDELGNIRNEFPFGSDLTVRIHYYAVRRIEKPLFNLRFFHKEKSIFEASMLIDGCGPDFVEGKGFVECTIPNLPLTPKVYDILLFIRSSEGITDITTMRKVMQFRITDDEIIDRILMRGPMGLTLLRQGSPVYLNHSWRW